MDKKNGTAFSKKMFSENVNLTCFFALFITSQHSLFVVLTVNVERFVFHAQFRSPGFCHNKNSREMRKVHFVLLLLVPLFR